MSNISKKSLKISLYSLLLPVFVFAAPNNITEFIDKLTGILLKIIPLIFSLALVAVLWAGARLVIHSDNETERTESRNMLMWGIITLFIMVSMWGLVNLLRNTFFPY